MHVREVRRAHCGQQRTQLNWYDAAAHVLWNAFITPDWSRKLHHLRAGALGASLQGDDGQGSDEGIGEEHGKGEGKDKGKGKGKGKDHKGTGKSDMEGRNAVHVGDLLYCAWPEAQAVYSDGLEGVVEAQGLHAFFCKAWRARSARIPVLYSSQRKAESSMQS